MIKTTITILISLSILVACEAKIDNVDNDKIANDVVSGYIEKDESRDDKPQVYEPDRDKDKETAQDKPVVVNPEPQPEPKPEEIEPESRSEEIEPESEQDTVLVETEKILRKTKFATDVVDDKTIPRGESKISVKGVEGLEEITVEITYVNGVRKDYKEISIEVISAPVTEIVLRGIGEFGDGTQPPAISGVTIKYDTLGNYVDLSKSQVANLTNSLNFIPAKYKSVFVEVTKGVGSSLIKDSNRYGTYISIGDENFNKEESSNKVVFNRFADYVDYENDFPSRTVEWQEMNIRLINHMKKEFSDEVKDLTHKEQFNDLLSVLWTNASTEIYTEEVLEFVSLYK